MSASSSQILRVVCSAALVSVVALFSGCATASQSSAMAVVDAPAAITKHVHTVSLQVTGGEETSSMGMSSISNTDFAAAIKTSIEQSALFSKVSEVGAAYQVFAHIVRLDRPSFGGSFTVKMEVTWQLRRLSDQSLVWEKAIMSSHTAKMSDAFVGTTRLRLANEGAARANIKDAIDQMGSLTLP
ncbi:hypothetical protein [Oleiharenicola lentus]|uniref:hypothetical protein n=1 Tax=Oleiharenicola lentus TaxID=2508720 RepID=UPI003F664E76